MIYFSKTTNGFYDDEIMPISKMPDDKVSITVEEYRKIFDEHVTGRPIVADGNGYPYTIARVVTTADLSSEAREKRNQLLVASDWTQLPDVPESSKIRWASYRQQLRDIPQQENFPDSIIWPSQP